MDVFISYARADRALADKLAAALGADGTSVHVERDGDGAFGERARTELLLERAGWCCVLWSRSSVASADVVAEATAAHQRGKLLPIFVDDCRAPAPLDDVDGVGFKKAIRLGPELATFFAARAGDAPRTTRRLPILPQRIQDEILQIALEDPETPGDFIDKCEIKIDDPAFFPVLFGRVRWRTNVTAEICREAPGAPASVAGAERAEWEPFSETMSGVVTLRLPGVPGDPDLSRALMEFDLAGAYLPAEIPKEERIERPTPLDDTISRGRRAINDMIEAEIIASLPGESHRALEFAPDTVIDADYVYLPLWRGEVRYRTDKFPTLSSGVRRDDVLFDAPKDNGLEALREARANTMTNFIGVAAGMVLGSAALHFFSGVAYEDGWARMLDPYPTGLFKGYVLGAMVAAGALALWPLADRAKTRSVLAQLRRNAKLRAAAAEQRLGADYVRRNFETDMQDSDGRRIGAYLLSYAAAALFALAAFHGARLGGLL